MKKNKHVLRACPILQYNIKNYTLKTDLHTVYLTLR